MSVLLEICAGSYESVLSAVRGGAARVELCSGLEVGGLTPSIGLLRAAVAVPGIRKHVLVRPRGGDFLYTREELQLMADDIRMAGEAGADGVVTGVLTPEGDVDKEAMAQLVVAAGGMDVTFHRAFDLCRDPKRALEDIIALGCTRLLTSGQAATAEGGIPLIANLVEQAAGRLSVMPGCGVGVQNARKIIAATGACEIHASAKERRASRMGYRRDGVEMGQPGADEYARTETSEATVRELVSLLSGL